MKKALVLAAALLTGACATAQPPLASDATQERWERIMRQMRADSAAAADAAAGSEADWTTSSRSGFDGAMPAGIDLARFELPVQYNERVQEYIDLYAQRRRNVFTGWYRRMGRYRGYIEERLAAHGLPRELVYLPLIESGYETDAKSHASAVGLWQFMAPTARSEGLEVSDYVDERRDPFRATDAAIRHLQGLHRTFGSWYLAAAAYNSGATRIARLMKESYGTVKGADDAFWAVQDLLPKETRDYVPGLLAATIIGEHPELFGLTGIAQEPAVRFETVTVPGATDLRAVARAASVDLARVKMLNPHYVRGITPPDRESEVRVPVGSAAGFRAAFLEIPTDERTRDLARTHIVQPGETLSGIAKRYGMSVSAIQEANRIKRPDAVAAGRKLILPQS